MSEIQLIVILIHLEIAGVSGHLLGVQWERPKHLDGVEVGIEDRDRIHSKDLPDQVQDLRSRRLVQIQLLGSPAQLVEHRHIAFLRIRVTRVTLLSRREAAYQQCAKFEHTKSYVALRVRDVPAVGGRDEEVTLAEHGDHGKHGCLPKAPMKSDQNDRQKIE